MKITKEMGMACLLDMNVPLRDWRINEPTRDALFEIGWCDFTSDEPCVCGEDHWYTALAMCAAIAGVKP